MKFNQRTNLEARLLSRSKTVSNNNNEGIQLLRADDFRLPLFVSFGDMHCSICGEYPTSIQSNGPLTYHTVTIRIVVRTPEVGSIVSPPVDNMVYWFRLNVNPGETVAVPIPMNPKYAKGVWLDKGDELWLNWDMGRTFTPNSEAAMLVEMWYTLDIGRTRP